MTFYERRSFEGSCSLSLTIESLHVSQNSDSVCRVDILSRWQLPAATARVLRVPSVHSALLTTKIQVLAFSLALAPELLLVPARHAMEL